MANDPGTIIAGAAQQVEVVGLVGPARPFVRALRIAAALLLGLVALGAAAGAIGATADAFDHRGANRATLIAVGMGLALAAAGLMWVAWRLGLYGAAGFKRPEPRGFPIQPLSHPPHAA